MLAAGAGAGCDLDRNHSSEQDRVDTQGWRLFSWAEEEDGDSKEVLQGPVQRAARGHRAGSCPTSVLEEATTLLVMVLTASSPSYLGLQT